MSTLKLYCARPQFRELDLQSARFVVARGTITVNGQQLTMGQEVPPGALSAYALECEYQRPLCRIDELNYALTQDGLREACEANGVKVAAPTAQSADEATVLKPDLTSLDHKGLVSLCELYGLSKNGNTKQLRQRLEQFLA